MPVAKVWAPETVAYEAQVFACGGSLYQARRDTAQKPPGADWLLIAGRGRDGRDGTDGGQGPQGARGPAGPRGHNGDRGGAEHPVTIRSWQIDAERYRASPLISNGQVGAMLELRPLFQKFLNETATAGGH